MGNYLVGLSLFFQQALSALLNILTSPFGVNGHTLEASLTYARGWLIQTGITLGDIDTAIQAVYTPMALGLENILEFAQNLLFVGIELPGFADPINLYSVVNTVLANIGIDLTQQSLLVLAFNSALLLVVVVAFVSLFFATVDVIKRLASILFPSS